MPQSPDQQEQRDAEPTAPQLGPEIESTFREDRAAAVLVGNDRRVLRVTANFLRTFELTDVVGADLGTVMAPRVSESATPWAMPAVPGGSDWERRDIRTRDGRWFSRRSVPVLNRDGGTAGAVVTFAPIQVHGVLEERLKLAMESASLVWWDWDFGTGTIAIYGSPACILGYGVDTLPRAAVSWFDLTHPDDLFTVQETVESCMAGKTQQWSLEHRLRALDGSWRWVLNSGKLAEFDSLGRATRMLGIVIDIQVRRSAEENLRRDAEILAQLADVVISCDAQCRILYVNDAFESVFGWPKSSAVGQEMTFRLPSHVAHHQLMNYQRRVLAGECFSEEWEDYKADGSRIWVQWRCRPSVDGSGRVTGAINVVTDIDARKRAEMARERLQQQLLQAQRLDTLGSLAGGIAHDFNNILAVIFGFTEVALATTNPNEQSAHYYQQVLKAAARARELVNRILSFSRFHEPERKPVRLGELIADAAKFIRAALPSTLELKTTFECDCPPTLADSHQLHQVLMNLATNAAHAMGGQKGQLELRLRCETIRTELLLPTGKLSAGAYALIEVSDHGHGMDSETQGKIFDPFFTTKKKGEGTGLGLSVVSAIMQGHKGGVEVRSVVGEGTTFTVYVPIVANVIAPPPSPEDSLAPRLRARGETVAIIDDEETVATTAEKVLQGLGYTTQTFPSAHRFLEVFSLAPSGIDLLLSDQTMPRMTGMDLAIQLRQAGHELPILLMTGFSNQLHPSVIDRIGKAAVIKKPFERLELAQAVRSLLDRVGGQTRN